MEGTTIVRVLISLPFLLLVCVSLGLVAKGAFYFRRAIQVSRADPIDVGAVGTADGFVEFQGRAEFAPESEPVNAPFSGTECCYCRYRVYRRAEDGWTEIYRDHCGRSLRVTDPTGSVTVSLDDERVTGPSETVERVEQRTRPPNALANRVWAHDDVDLDANPEILDTCKWAREYRETRIEPGETVHVLGTVDAPATEATEPVVDVEKVTLEGERKAAADYARAGVGSFVFAALLGAVGSGFAYSFLPRVGPLASLLAGLTLVI